jgi:hypothetical protein
MPPKDSSKEDGPSDGGPVWVEGVDPASGVTYYYNTFTKQSTWEKPADFQSKSNAAPPPPKKDPEYYWDGLRWVAYAETSQSGLKTEWHYDEATRSYGPVAANYSGYTQTPTAAHDSLVASVTDAAVTSEAAEAQKRLLAILAKSSTDSKPVEDKPKPTDATGASESIVELYKAWQTVEEHGEQEQPSQEPEDETTYTDPGGYVVLDKRSGGFRNVGQAYDIEINYMNGPPEGAYGNKFFDYDSWAEKRNQQSRLKAEKDKSAPRKKPYGGPRTLNSGVY